MNNIENKVEEALKKPPQFTRLKRHLSTLLLHSTPKKIFNLMRVEMQRKLRREKVTGYPYIIIIDPGNICNLKCPLCPTGMRSKRVTRDYLQLNDFKNIVDNFKPYAYEIILHNWGEPFLNKDILAMIRYCADNNIGSNLSSNMNVLPFSGEDLVNSGLEYLIVSLDGTTQDVYSRYRINGNIDTAMANLQQILAAKKKLQSKTPVIEWQYLVMKHNVHQIEEAKKLATELDVDLLRFIPVGLPFDTPNKLELAQEWYPNTSAVDGEQYIEDRFLQKPIKGGCFYLYRSITITATGRAAPCCAVWKNEDNFGDILHSHFSEIWNNSSYQSARALFGGAKTASHEKTTCCSRCTLFKK